MAQHARQVYLGHHEIWIQLYRAPKCRLSVAGKYAASDQGHAEPIKRNRVVRVEPCGSSGERLSLAKPRGVRGASPRLNQYKAKGDQGFRIVRRDLDCLAINFFGILPALLISKHITQTVMRTRVARLQFKGRAIGSLSGAVVTPITRVVTISKQVFKLFFYFLGVGSRPPFDGPRRFPRAVSFGILRSNDTGAA